MMSAAASKKKYVCPFVFIGDIPFLPGVSIRPPLGFVSGMWEQGLGEAALPAGSQISINKVKEHLETVCTSWGRLVEGRRLLGCLCNLLAHGRRLETVLLSSCRRSACLDDGTLVLFLPLRLYIVSETRAL